MGSHLNSSAGSPWDGRSRPVFTKEWRILRLLLSVNIGCVQSTVFRAAPANIQCLLNCSQFVVDCGSVYLAVNYLSPWKILSL